MIKILFFFSTTRIGGAETNILKISKELSLNGYEIHFASLLNDGPMLERVDFSLGSYTEIGDYMKCPVKAFCRLRELMKQYHFDIISNFGFRVELFSRSLSKLLGVKKIVSNIRSADTDKTRLELWLDRLTSWGVDEWVSNSEAAKMLYHRREGYPLDKIHVIYNFVEESRHQVIDKRFNFRIGVLANIRECKGHLDLIPLCKKLLERNIVPHFYLGGTDHMNGVFHVALNEAKIESYFTFEGYVDDILSFFNKIDIFLLPSYMEGMPTVILEAMNLGVPVVSTNVGGIVEQVRDGWNGFLADPGDIDKYVEAISLLEQESLRNLFIQNSYNVLTEKFSKETSVMKWINVFSK